MFNEHRFAHDQFISMIFYFVTLRPANQKLAHGNPNVVKKKTITAGRRFV